MSRLCKIALTAGVALYVSLIAADNVLDYDINFAFVQHVMSMDTIFPRGIVMWRAVTNRTLHHVFYGIIIAWEAVTAVLCWAGAYRMSRALRADAVRFEQSKRIALAGLTVGSLLWLVAFLTVGGEWFAMWRSPHWNGQNAAFRMFTVTGVVLLFVHQRDPDA
jgi:predicted small integral membrane protein